MYMLGAYELLKSFSPWVEWRSQNTWVEWRSQNTNQTLQVHVQRLLCDKDIMLI